MVTARQIQSKGLSNWNRSLRLYKGRGIGGYIMKCWVCKQAVDKAFRVFYTDGMKERARNICEHCYPMIKFTACHYVEVKRL